MKYATTRASAITAAAAALGLFAAPALAHIDHWLPVSNVKAQIIKADQVSGRQRDTTAPAVSADRQTLTYSGKTIRLVVQTGPEDDMLSYRIAGVRNPTLVVPRDATLSILFVNVDADMKHDLRFTAAAGPFPDTPDRKESVGTTVIAHAEKGAFHAEQFTIRAARAGTYRYLCTVRGHAKGGMLGTLVVK